ncbi:MAG: hypothetical protein QME66_11430 [Candidatus Eisenbacteria bacterium]|nr:hypothetical protein [Candidatus Eisenbacteria bacterium]
MKLEHLAASVLILGVLVVGCGHKMSLPPPPEAAPIPGDVYTWLGEWDGLSKVSDILLTRHAPGASLIAVGDSLKAVAFYPGSVSASKNPKVNPSVDFSSSGLLSPKLIAEGSNGDIYIYDEGDTTIKKFGRTGGAGTWSFRDTTSWVSVVGIAVDDSGNVFVADEVRKTVKKYSSSGYDLGIWTDQGLGDGYIGKPSQLYYDGQGLLIADKGDGIYPPRVIKIRTDIPRTGTITAVKEAEGKALLDPSDVYADKVFNIYVADTGNNRVLKLTPYGVFEKVVNSYIPPTATAVSNVIAITASENRVHMVDKAASRVVIYEYK